MTVTDIGVALGLIVIAIVLIVGAKVLLEAALRLPLDAHLFVEDNPAIGIACAGFYAGVIATLAAAIGTGATGDPLADLGLSGLYGTVGVVLQGASLRFTPKVLVPRFDIHEELVRDRNVGAGLVLAASGIASGLVVAAAMQGEAPGGIGGGLLSMLVAFAAGQLSMALLTRMHRLVAHFDVHAEIREGNVAAGCVLAGAILGNGILLHWGLRGDFVPEAIGASLLPLGIAFAAGIVLMPLVRLLVSRLFFGGVGFDKEIADDKNVAAGVLELVAHPGLALLIVSVLP